MTILETLAMLSGGLFAGGALYVSLVEQPARMGLGPRAAMEQFRSSYRRAAPWQAATAVICALSGVLASIRGASWSWAIGALLIGLAVPFTLIVIRPTTHRLLRHEAAGEVDAQTLLIRWARLHWIRSALGAAGLVVLIRAALARSSH
jgi:hypothetical protein